MADRDRTRLLHPNMAEALWNRELVVARRETGDQPLVLVTPDAKGKWQLKSGSESKLWLVADEYPEHRDVGRWTIVRLIK